MAGEAELTVISLGGGVQSSVLSLMAADGLIKPMPDFAVFADTGWEPEIVYRHLDWLADQLPFPIERIGKRSIREDILAGTNSTGQQFTSIPAFVRSFDGKTAIVRRQCTREYKLSPIQEALRDLLGLGFGQRVPAGMFVELWIGISVDESIRIKPSREKWIVNRWPLIDLGLSRSDCINWFKERFPGRILPRSACIGCPYHTDAEWLHMKRHDPKSWADAVYVDNALRTTERSKRFDGEMYLHSSRQALSDVNLMNGSNHSSQFGEECEGLCGV